MAQINCGCSSWLKMRLKKGQKRVATRSSDYTRCVKMLNVEVEHRKISSEAADSGLASVAVPVPLQFMGTSRCKVKVLNHDMDPKQLDYKEEKGHGKTPMVKTDNSDFHSVTGNSNTGEGIEMISSEQIWASTELERSCSNLAIRYRDLDDQIPSSISKSYKEKKRSIELCPQKVEDDAPMSPVSVRTNRSADNVILKKHSSSQILPSGSRTLWWKLFLWSHRNLHIAHKAKPQTVEFKPSVLNQQGGYASDSMHPEQAMGSSKLRPRSLLARESMEANREDTDNHSWDGVYGGSHLSKHNQWVAFPVDSSPLERVSEWIAETSKHPPYQGDDDQDHIRECAFPSPFSRKNNTSPTGEIIQSSQQAEEIWHANAVIQSLNANSAVAHITGLGLKAIPSISHLISLRSVNLSGNSIANISPGSLPKGLHILNLSKNKISSIEGLRELTRLRILDLSYNRISSIGQGLSSCTLIKELCLAGNKISNVEGLHRLLKLTILDLSFNKITTTKALDQLVANGNSLISVHLLGNPFHTSTSDDQLRKMMCSLIPKLALLNRQPVNPQKAREIRAVVANSKGVILGNSSRNTQRKAMRKTTNVGMSSTRRSSHHGSSTQKMKHSSTNRSSSNIVH